MYRNDNYFKYIKLLKVVEGGIEMKRYFIKAWFGDWREVSEEKANNFIKGMIERCPNPKRLVIENHIKVIQ